MAWKVVDGQWYFMWYPDALLVMGSFILVLLGGGWLSLRYLRAAPDFPHKAKWLWGARWLGPIAVAAFFGLVACGAVLWSGDTYDLDTMICAWASALCLTVVPMAMFMLHQTNGWIAWHDALWAWLRRRTVDWAAESARHERVLRRWWYRWCVAFPIAGSSIVVGVLLLPILTSAVYPRGWHWEEALEPRWDFRGAVVERVFVTNRRWTPQRIWVRVAERTSEADLREVLADVQRLLDYHKVSRQFLIEVYTLDGRKLQTRYTPRDSARLDPAVRRVAVDAHRMLTGFALVPLGILLLLAGYCFVIGRHAVRRLRQAPDLPHKAEMLWGARWTAPIYIGMVLVPLGMEMVLVLVGFPYIWAALFIATALFGVWGLVVAFLPWQYFGWRVGAAARRYRPENAGVAWARYVAWVEREARSWSWRFSLPLLSAGLVTGGLYVALDIGLPSGRRSMVCQWESGLATEMEAAMVGVRVRDVFVHRQWPEAYRTESGWDRWDSEHPEASLVHVYLEEGATAHQARRAAHHAGEILARRQVEGEWLIETTAGSTCIRDLWGPTGEGSGG